MKLTKSQRSARMWEGHPLSKADLALLDKAQRKARRLRLLAYIDKARHVDEKTLQEIGDEVGLTRQRIHQLLALIEGKGSKRNRRLQD